MVHQVMCLFQELRVLVHYPWMITRFIKLCQGHPRVRDLCRECGKVIRWHFLVEYVDSIWSSYTQRSRGRNKCSKFRVQAVQCCSTTPFFCLQQEATNATACDKCNEDQENSQRGDKSLYLELDIYSLHSLISSHTKV